MEYIIIFILSCMLTNLAYQLDKRGSKIFVVIFNIFAVLLPVLIAGFRYYTVGTDVSVYGAEYFRIATLHTNLFEYMEVVDTNFLYAILNFIVSRFTDKVYIFLSIVQVVMIVPIYIVIWENRKKANPWIAYLAYFTLLFPRFLNIIRQGLAVSFVIFSYRYIIKRKLINFLIITLTAFLFHTTAIFALPLYFIYGLCVPNEKNKENKFFNIKFIYMTFAVLIITIFFIDYPKIMLLLFELNLVPDTFSVYMSKLLYDNPDLDISTNVYKLFWIAVAFIYLYKTKNKTDKEDKFFFILLIYDIIFWNVNYRIAHAERLSYYYGTIPMVLFLPKLAKVFKYKKINHVVIQNCCVIAVLAFYWIYKFMILNAGKIYPYITHIHMSNL